MAANENGVFRTNCVTMHCNNKLIWYFPKTYKIC
ncbi:hypothetical protein SPX_09420 [Sporomusa paucivorans]